MLRAAAPFAGVGRAAGTALERHVKTSIRRAASLGTAVALAFCCAACGQVRPNDVLPEYHNQEVTSLAEDCETVRLATGAAWDDALDCRAMAGYLRPWAKEGKSVGGNRDL